MTALILHSSLPSPSVDRRIALDACLRGLLLCGPPVDAARTCLELVPFPELVATLDRLSRIEHASMLTRERALEVAGLVRSFAGDWSSRLPGLASPGRVAGLEVGMAT